MRKLFPLLAVAVLFSGISFVVAEEGKEVTITGDGVCAKCALKEQKTCQSVITVKENGSDVRYYLAANDVSKKFHGSSGICTATTDAPIKTKVVGTVAEKDGKKVITATSIDKVD